MLTGCLSLLAFVAFSPLPTLVPKPLSPLPALPGLKAGAGDGSEVEAYLQMSVDEFASLNLHTRRAVNAKLLEKGHRPIDVHWTSYEEDQRDASRLTEIRKRAQATLKELKVLLVTDLTSQTNFGALTTRMEEQRKQARARCDRQPTRPDATRARCDEAHASRPMEL